MTETAQQYTQRLLGNVAGKDARRVQRATPQKLALLMKRLNPKELGKRPGPGKWSVTEILAHLADSELAVSWRLRSTLACDGIALQAYDQDVWASTFQYAKSHSKTSLERFRVLREANLALLKTVPKMLLDNYGMHAERGKETVAHLTNMVAGHDLNHLRQVETIVKSARARKR